MADQSDFVYFQDLCVGTLHLNMSCRFTQKGLVTLALHPLAHQLANATSRFGGFAGAALGRLFIRTAVLHLAEHAFALQLFLQDAERLINIVFTYSYVHGPSHLSVWLVFPAGRQPGIPAFLSLGRTIAQAVSP